MPLPLSHPRPHIEQSHPFISKIYPKLIPFSHFHCHSFSILSAPPSVLSKYKSDPVTALFKVSHPPIVLGQWKQNKTKPKSFIWLWIIWLLPTTTTSFHAFLSLAHSTQKLLVFFQVLGMPSSFWSQTLCTCSSLFLECPLPLRPQSWLNLVPLRSFLLLSS